MVATKQHFLYLSAGIVAFSCIAYELLLGSYATFLMGASIFQYSLVISLMMFSMGLGAFVTQYFSKNSYLTFLLVELFLAWIALLAVPLMYTFFSINIAPTLVLVTFVIFLGSGIGMEIPLISEIIKTQEALSTLLFADYLGGFLGGIAFPLILFPSLGFFSIGALLALINSLVALSFFWIFREQFKNQKLWVNFCVILTVLACLLEFTMAETLRLALESYFFGLGKN